VPSLSPAQAAIFNALFSATAGLDLKVRTHGDLTGASVAGPTIEAYVLAVSKGYQVDMWRGNGSNPFKIERVADLDNAVKIAVAAALGRRRSGRRPAKP
jgi:hypothetical protein